METEKNPLFFTKKYKNFIVTKLKNIFSLPDAKNSSQSQISYFFHFLESILLFSKMDKKNVQNRKSKTLFGTKNYENLTNNIINSQNNLKNQN